MQRNRLLENHRAENQREIRRERPASGRPGARTRPDPRSGLADVESGRLQHAADDPVRGTIDDATAEQSALDSGDQANRDMVPNVGPVHTPK